MSYRIDPYDKSIVIEGFDKGIADSPYLGISDMRNVNIISIPTEASVNFEVQNIVQSYTGTLVSCDSGADTVTITNTTGIVAIGTVITFSGAGLSGTGITAGTKYVVGATSTTFQLFASEADRISNTPLNITGTGTGTFASVAMGEPVQRWFDSVSAKYYFLDSNGRLWYTTSATGAPKYLLGNDTTTTTNASGNGLAVYRGYVFVFRNALIDYYNITTGAWTYGWQTMNTASGTNNSHYAFYGRTDYIFYCDGAYLGSFKEQPGATFDPATAATYQWNKIALSLPRDDIAQCLEELGTTLLIGGQKNAIYQWNQTDSTFTSRILIAENFIQRMQTVNTNTYILAGQRGRIYITNGSQANLYKKVPDHLSGVIEPYFQWGDICTVRNQIYFSLQCRNSASGTVITEYGGLWAIDLDSTALRLTNQLSYGTYDGISHAMLPVVPTPANNPPFPTYTQGVAILIGWNSGASTYGIDYAAAVPYTSSEAYIDSDLIPIGTFDKVRDFTRIEYKLAKPMVSGESVSLYYRTEFSQSYTLIDTDTATSTYLPFSKSSPVNFKNAQWIQLRAVLNSVSDSPSYVRLKEIRLIGIVE